MSLTEHGVAAIARQLRAELPPILRAAELALAVEVQRVVAPYPPSRRRGDRRWYERGYGPRWRRRDGSVGGRKTSETLGRRWSIRPSVSGVELSNTASYAEWVHGRRQAGWMRERNWRTIEDGERAARSPDVLRRTLAEPIAAVLHGGRRTLGS